MAKSSAEKRTEASPENLTQALSVLQPDKIKKFSELLDTIDLIDKVGERIGEDKTGDMGAGGATGAAQGQHTQSWRDEAIASLPEATVMQRKLEQHIKKEVRQLHREASKISRNASKKGAAHKLTELYARIRRLNGLLAELFEASIDVMKRLYIRIFVDKQAVL